MEHFKYIAVSDLDEIFLTNETYKNITEFLINIEKENEGKSFKSFKFGRSNFVTDSRIDKKL